VSLSCFSPYPTKDIKTNKGKMSKGEKYIEEFEQGVRNSFTQRTQILRQAQNKAQ